MIVRELFEDAGSDLSNLGEAQKIASDFGQWVSKHNEDVPLGKLGLFRRISELNTIFVNGTSFGQNENLNIGFGWNADGSRTRDGAVMFNGKGPNGVVFYIIILVDHDPSKDTDVIFGVKWQHLIHELTHYLDRMRQKGQSSKNKFNGLVRGSDSNKGPEHYYNHDLERNAYFQQGLHEIMTRFPRMPESEFATFDKFLKNNLMDFDYNFRNNLNAQNKKKFMARLFKLYEFLKAKKQELPA
jgi:hypothetical protein